MDEHQRGIQRALRIVGDGLQRAADALAKFDWAGLAAALQEYQELVPENLTPQVMLSLTCGDGGTTRAVSSVPLAWVIPADLLQSYTLADGAEADRLGFIIEHQSAILAECDTVLEPLDLPAADEARIAIAALRAGFTNPAQSHAANIIDSVVLARFAPTHFKGARREAVRRGTVSLADPAEVSVRALVDRVVFGPLVPCYVRWYPETNDPLPDGFARHATSHAVHVSGVFSPTNALIAVMLATSLVVHHRRERCLAAG
jgi:hypothetical protein